jgi:hypothetical protein
MASSKRIQANDIPSVFFPISKHGGVRVRCKLRSCMAHLRFPQDSAPSHLKNQLSLLKRGRNDATVVVVASSFTSAHVHVDSVAPLEPAVKTQAHAGHHPQSIFTEPSCHSVDKKMKLEPIELVPSNAYLQMPSR